MTIKPIPEGYHSLTPYLIVRDAASAIAFYKSVFGATELMRLDAPGGKIGHAEIQIGDSRLMLADEHPEMGAVAPQKSGPSSVGLCLYVENADEVVARATEAGATVKRPLQNQFYGDRSATLEDPFGHSWTVATHIEDVTPDELRRRMEKMTSE